MDERIAQLLANSNVVRHTSIAFVVNPVWIDPSILPFEFSDGSILDKATLDERNSVKTNLAERIGSGGTANMASCYECDTIIENLEGGGRAYRYNPLPEQEWKYYVVRSPSNRGVNVDLHYAASVCSSSIDLLTFHFTEISHGWRAEALEKYFRSSARPTQTELTLRSLDEIVKTYDLLVSTIGETGAESKFPEIRRALLMLDALYTLSANSGFLCLGLFAIIEMLITHAPSPKDRGDSITHQVKTKMSLLSNRFDKQLPISQFFGKTAPDKVWSSLYSYRSSLAHGGVPNFRGDHQVLISPDNADEFLLVTVKSLIRNALKEPSLYRDLRAC